MTALSVIIPAFNEEHRLEPTLRAIQAQLPAAEILVVDDGSTDRTADLARLRGARVLSLPKNRGKGRALREGMLAARGRRMLMSDADLSTPIEDFRRLEQALDEGADLAIGSRRMSGSRVLQRQPLFRETLGRGFTLLSQLVLNVRFRDFTCGFKLFERDCARDLFSSLTIERWGYDAEILFLAVRRGYRCREVPVTWRNDEDTKVRLGRDVVRSLLDLVNIRRNASRGVYGVRRG